MKKPFSYRMTTRDIVKNMQRDFDELTAKQEMVTVAELRNEMSKDYMTNLYSFLEKCKKRFNDDFIIEVFRWHEIGDRKTIRVKRRQILALPTPRPGRSYYYYNSNKDTLELLWDLPPKKACEWGYKNRHKYGVQLPDALKTILDYYDGTLTRRADEINKQIAHHRSSYHERSIQ